jgi:cytochrome c553
MPISPISRLIVILTKINPSKNPERSHYCVECHRAAGRQNYQENKERYFKQAKKRDKELDELINSYKDKPCADCGIKYPPYVMDLDHVNPSNKFLKLSTMRRRRMSFDKIKEELVKCEVVCANCHRERTNKQNPARYTKTG